MRDAALLLVVALSVFCPLTNAQSVKSVDFTIHQEYTSTRALGMGNAFIAVADDHSAIFYNPATLAFRKDGHLRMLVRGGTTPETLDLFDEIDAVEKKPDAEQPQAYSDLIVSHYGDHFYFRAPTIGAVWARPGWGIAFLPVDLSLDAAVHRQIGPMINTNLYADTTLAVSYAKKLKWLNKRHELSWGTTIKSMHRIYVGEAISAGQLADGSAKIFEFSRATEGLTFDLDLGLFWRPPGSGWVKPAFAFVGRNLVDYGFKQNFHFIDPNSGEPPPLQRRFDVGSRFDLPQLWVFEPKFVLDVKDIGHDMWTWKKGLHYGFEMYWRMFNWWKGHWSVGMNQQYWTAGFGARLAWFHLDIATFGEEVGTTSEPLESRRYMMELALDF